MPSSFESFNDRLKRLGRVNILNQYRDRARLILNSSGHKEAPLSLDQVFILFVNLGFNHKIKKSRLIFQRDKNQALRCGRALNDLDNSKNMNDWLFLVFEVR